MQHIAELQKSCPQDVVVAKEELDQVLEREMHQRLLSKGLSCKMFQARRVFGSNRAIGSCG